MDQPCIRHRGLWRTVNEMHKAGEPSVDSMRASIRDNYAGITETSLTSREVLRRRP